MTSKHFEPEEERLAIQHIVARYAKTWTLLIQYDEDRLPLPAHRHKPKRTFAYEKVIQAIVILKNQLISQSEASQLFGQERGAQLQGILANIDQTFGGNELYPSVEEKAAHLFYFIIKDHPFSDGNKRIGAFLFVLFLRQNDLLDVSSLNENVLVTLALFIAESDPSQKGLMVKLVCNLLCGRE